jgi:glycosyltransferase involved in cell wall biosynthesis
MKVLIVTNMYPIDEHSYYGIFVKEYVESIESLGIKVDVFFVNGKKSRLEYFRTIPGIRKKIINGEYDIIHAQHTYCVYQIWFGRLFKASSCPPVILTLHEGEVFAPKGNRSTGANPIKKLIYIRALKRWACQKADHIVSVEQKVLDVLRIQNPRSIIPPGVNIDLFKPIDRIECKQKIGSLSDGYVVFFPAKPTSLKGFHLLKEISEA